MDQTQVGDRDVVIYFSPSPFATSPPPAQPQNVRAGPYQTQPVSCPTAKKPFAQPFSAPSPTTLREAILCVSVRTTDSYRC